MRLRHNKSVFWDRANIISPGYKRNYVTHENWKIETFLDVLVKFPWPTHLVSAWVIIQISFLNDGRLNDRFREPPIEIAAILTGSKIIRLSLIRLA